MTAALLLRELEGRKAEIDFLLVSHLRGPETPLSSDEIFEISDGVKSVLLGQRGFQTPDFRDHRWERILTAFNTAYRRISPDGDLVEYGRELTQKALNENYVNPNPNAIKKPVLPDDVAKIMVLQSQDVYRHLLVKSDEYQSSQLGDLQNTLLPHDDAILTFYSKMFGNALPQNQCSSLA